MADLRYSETLAEHLLVRRPFAFCIREEEVDLFALLGGERGSPQWVEVVYSFPREKNLLLLGLLAVYCRRPGALRSETHGQILLIDCTGNCPRPPTPHARVIRAYTHKELTHHLVMLNEAEANRRCVRLVVIDGSNMFDLADDREKRHRSKPFSRRSLPSKKRSNLADRVFDLTTTLITNHKMLVLNLRVDHFYQEGAVEYCQGEFLMVKERLDMLKCTNPRIEMTCLYLLNATDNQTIRRIVDSPAFTKKEISWNDFFCLKHTSLNDPSFGFLAVSSHTHGLSLLGKVEIDEVKDKRG